ncbi:hypothetical protein GCM10009422_10210 [Brevundimonas kwangchunensis]|uniref:Uncharacterized protein n=1 Tax=Brevundimonas kwangchunensis TaxID=322163 RepID=A0ABN1GR48_9CAUL
MSGRAGSMESMASAFSAIRQAIRQTNSGKPGPFTAGVAGETGEVIGARCGPDATIATAGVIKSAAVAL